MVIMVWLQTGFAMVILSAAIKSVPEDIMEAARIDGANGVPGVLAGDHPIDLVDASSWSPRPWSSRVMEGLRHRLG